jgi:hypothetical protein
MCRGRCEHSHQSHKQSAGRSGDAGAVCKLGKDEVRFTQIGTPRLNRCAVMLLQKRDLAPSLPRGICAAVTTKWMPNNRTSTPLPRRSGLLPSGINSGRTHRSNVAATSDWAIRSAVGPHRADRRRAMNIGRNVSAAHQRRGAPCGAPQEFLPLQIGRKERRKLVGATGFEPATPRSRTECSTRLSHAPTNC